MRFFIDFEATQPDNEIISVGVVCENGKTFYKPVKPTLSNLTSYITKMTGITQEELDRADDINKVFSELYGWMMSNGGRITDWEILSYGRDIEFVKATLPAITTDPAFIFAAVLMARIKDGSEIVFKYFNGGVSLINAYNYILDAENRQNHNPLDDALMFKKVYETVKDLVPLEEYPLQRKSRNSADDKYVPPTGVFYCKGVGKKTKEIKFDNIEKAIDWFINNKVGKEQRASVRRSRVMTQIMKSIRTNKEYANAKWRREKPVVKNEKEEE